MYDIFYLGEEDDNWKDAKSRYPLAIRLDRETPVSEIQKKSFTKHFWLIWYDTFLTGNLDIPEYRLTEWDDMYIHIFKNGNIYDGVCLIPKTMLILDQHFRERTYDKKKEVDIVASVPRRCDIFCIDSYEEYKVALEKTTTDSFWMTSKNIKLKEDFKFDYQCSRTENHAFIHRVKDKDMFNGVFLLSKFRILSKKEIAHRFPIDKKEWPVVASGPVKYDIFEIETYDDYLRAMEESKTEMFWMTSPNLKIADNFHFDIYFSHNENEYERKSNHSFAHKVDDKILYNGVHLLSKHKPVSKKEIEHRFLIDKKEWNIVASNPIRYDIFEIETYDDYLRAMEESKTEMFWMTSKNLDSSEFHFDTYFSHDQNYERHENHSFIHRVRDKDLFNGVYLMSKHKPVSKKEIEHRFLIDKKEWDIVASGPVRYDIFEIETYDDYLRAMEESKTEMFWMTSPNLKIADNFHFDIYFSHNQNYERHENHSFAHKVDDKILYYGVHLLSTHVPVSKKEIEHRFIANKKEWDIVASGPVRYDIFEIENYDDYLKAMEESKTEMFWMTSKNLDTSEFRFDIYFSHDQNYERHENHSFIHQVGDKRLRNGVYLMSKKKPVSKKEIDHRFLIDKKEWDIVASKPIRYDIFEIETYDDYLKAMEESKTEMFWMTSPNLKIADDFYFDIYFPHNEDYNRKENHAFIHRVGDKDLFNGVYLLSKHTPVSKKEIEYRFIANRKEWDIVASGPVQYDIFEIENYDDYLKAMEESKTEMFYLKYKELEIRDNFKFDIYFSHDNTFDRASNHVFRHIFRGTETYNGLVLASKLKKVSKKEVDFRYFIERKEHDIIASCLKPYDIVFISYDELSADANYQRLIKRFPNAKRIHGIKGIHQAHIEAAKASESEMIWIVDGDADIVDDFNFDHEASRYEVDAVHVWRSQNPVNDLVYGYGGVKLLPRKMTLMMDVNTPDMTTSISKKFIAVNKISNVTRFNTDPFNTWKSAFRECVKLSSKVIARQKTDETQRRLDIWCTVGMSSEYGQYAISGALAGKEYGQRYEDLVSLSRINDFSWLLEQFKKYHP